MPDSYSASHIDATNTSHGVDLCVQGITGLKCPGPDPRRSLPSWPVLGLTAVKLRPHLKLKLVGVVDD